MTIYTRRDFMRISVAGIAGAGIASASDTTVKPIIFATMNDMHIKDEASVAILDRAVAAINADTRIEFTVVLGDIATDGQAEELALAKAALEKLARPWFVVPGNHDVFLRAEDIYANYTATFGPVHWTQKENDWMFVGFNSCEGVMSDVTVSADELTWLQKTAAAIDKRTPLALFCHHPLNPNTKAYRIKNADEILALFAEHNLQIVAAGHWHGNQVEENADALFTTTACCSSTRNNFDKTSEKGYRLFHLLNNNVETEFVVVSKDMM